MKYKRCLLKLSGESFGGKNDKYDIEVIKSFARQIVKLNNEGMEIGIVIGGGNIWRGSSSKSLNLDNATGDYIGMLVTVMNSLVLEKNLLNEGAKSVIIQSKLEIKQFSEPYNYKKAIVYLKSGSIVIFAGGTGSPYFTTDTTAVLRAAEIEADIILLGKNGTDGVYDSDPKKNKNCKFYDKITYNQLQKDKLEIIDLTASILAMSSKIKSFIFDINKKNSLYDAAHGKIKGTLIQ